MRKTRIIVTGLILTVLALTTAVSGSAAPIKIGVNFELYGGLGWLGQTCINAIKLSIDQVNAAGGVLGRKIEPVYADNHSSPAGTGDTVEKLISRDKVVAILGPYSSRLSLAAAWVAQNRGVVLLTPTATEAGVTAVGDYIFRTCFIDEYQGIMMARFALNQLKITSAAILKANNGYSKALTEGFKEAFLKGGGQIVATEPVQADLQTLAAKVFSRSPGLIFAPLDYQDTLLAVKIIRSDLKQQLPILGGEGWNNSNISKSAGAAILNNIYFCDHYSVNNPDPLNLSFVSAYKKRFGKNPDTIAASAYDAAAIMAQAIAAAGDPQPAKIREALANLQFKGVTGNLRYDANRNPVKTGVIIAYQNGKQELLTVMEPEAANP